ncbi:adenylate/guanylate cyclase domain-containing protein [Magnetovibrio sp. PR-2]|uniref:adenylate/guanylate cyclase domain-containing protein n=1 Tax=Magnetovibrio sp. PR-2 TaxID=3120356 RepID=UPI002FCE08A1
MPSESSHTADEIHQPFPLQRLYLWRGIPAILIFAVLLSAALWYAFNSFTRGIYLEQSAFRGELIAHVLEDSAPEAWHAMQDAQATEAQLDELRNIFEEEIERQKLIKLKVYDLAGRIVFDVDPTKIGVRETAPALRTTLIDAVPLLQEKVEADGTAVYEIYTPYINDQGHLTAVFEMYETVTYLDGLLRRTAVPAIAVPIAIQLVFALVFGMLVKRGQRAIDRQSAAIVRLSERLKSFVSSSAVNAALSADTHDDIPSSKIEMTLFHSDVRDFTSYSETNDPERVVFFLNDLMGIQVAIVQRHGGDVDKMIGDALLVRFTGTDAQKRAIQASQEILQDVQKTGQPRGLGIGIYTGPVISGAIGPKDRRDFTVIGDSVNMSARLCSQASSGELVTDKETLNASALDGFSPSEDVAVKGRRRPIAINRWQVTT